MELNKRAIAERFSQLTRDKQSAFLETLRREDIDFAQLPIVPRSEREHFALSYAQWRQWFLWCLDSESGGYHITGAMRLKGTLDRTALRDSFTALVARHEALRTVFHDDGADGVVQVVRAESDFALQELDLSGVVAGERDAAAEEAVARLCDTPFDLQWGPLLRVGVLRLTDEEHVLVVVMHHIVSDGWSVQLIVDEFAADYRSRVTGEAWHPPALPIQYADYALWQRHWMEAGEQARQLAYWQAALGNEHPVLQLPTDHGRRRQGGNRAARHTALLPESLVQGLRHRAQEQGATLFMILLAGFQALLYRYTGQEEIRVGVPIANRHRAETAGVVGLFVNTQVLRNRVEGRATLGEVLERAKHAAVEAQDYQDLPFEQLVERLQPERHLDHHPLFQVMFNHQRHDTGGLRQLPALEVEQYPLGARVTHFELTLDTLEREDGGVEANFTYAAERFEAATMERLADHFRGLLERLVVSPEQSLGDMELLEEAEQQQLVPWSGQAQCYSDVEPIPREIERQAASRPEATAVVCGAEHLSFAEFEARANRLAHWLRRRDVGPDVRVGVGLARGVDLLVALYGVLKAGGAYVPLDPDYPAERLRYMQADAGIRLLLSHGEVLDHLPLVEGVEAIDLDRQDLTAESATPPPLTIHSQQLAYLIYTSGSTGTPKGVAVAHGALAMHCQSIADRYELTADDRELHFLSISFDGAHERWLSPLSRGARVVLRDQSLWSVQQTYDCLLDEGITVAAFPPSYLRQLAEWAEHQGRPPGVKTYCFAGEAFDRGMLRHAIAALQPDWVINGYGPTETVVTPTLWRAAAEEADFTSAYAPIGDLVGDRQGYVLDGNLNRVPPGMTGELYLGGCLARGYLDRPGTTAERFVPHPFADGERLYRTGDRVRLNVDRHLEYLGRLDQQIKLRGFRIELGEVEAALQSSEEVEEAVAGVCDMVSGQQLVGYVAGARASESDVKAHLSRSLPDYMIPSQVMVLERLPRLPNGKVDRGSLPQPMVSRDDRHEAPEGEAEAVLAMIWSEVLGIEQIGRHDNFFELGGHSLLAVQLVSRIQESRYADVTVLDIFRYPTLVAMAERVSTKSRHDTIDQSLENIDAFMDSLDEMS
ncbi:amino acid adenylation domain-containing protein [Halomonas llamarensis]|uniref:Amino acid adenylation domain-containing protein n=1 Tax=Halomonas llamarensis TaxID=2945104 RepID=A0ABT0STF8_9GAMM|nr:amino acid adenylation domain-containing protein [Halomonas llamarensis]MCL7931124.1 amino acid adenylation domain-containing protein [Halomonas llamarensis]